MLCVVITTWVVVVSLALDFVRETIALTKFTCAKIAEETTVFIIDSPYRNLPPRTRIVS